MAVLGGVEGIAPATTGLNKNTWCRQHKKLNPDISERKNCNRQSEWRVAFGAAHHLDGRIGMSANETAITDRIP